MPDSSKEALKKFLNDEAMVNAVRNVLRIQFLKPTKERDVQFLAAMWLTKDLFEEAWKELLKMKPEKEREEKPITQIGL